MTSTADNKRIIAQAFDGLARADPTAFVDSMADDIVWIIEGGSKVSGRYRRSPRILRHGAGRSAAGDGHERIREAHRD